MAGKKIGRIGSEAVAPTVRGAKGLWRPQAVASMSRGICGFVAVARFGGEPFLDHPFQHR